jgi:hypothetical protein
MVAIATSIWAARALTPLTAAAIQKQAPEGVAKVTLAGRSSRSDWSCRLYGPAGGDPIGEGVNGLTLLEAFDSAVADHRLGVPLVWCSACPEPALFQVHGEAYCAACEPTRGGTTR